MSMTFCTVHQWKTNLAARLEASGETIKMVCWQCDGVGTIECDLGHDHDCENCDGAGEIEMDADEVMSSLNSGYINDMYRADILADIKRFCEYTKRPDLEKQLVSDFLGQLGRLTAN